MTIRALIERPFRHYADFSGRSGRAEYWLLILVFILAMMTASQIGYGVMRLVGFEAYDPKTHIRQIYTTIRESRYQSVDVATTAAKGEEDRITFKLHRHGSEEGLHLHTNTRAWRHYHHSDEQLHGHKIGDNEVTIYINSSEDGITTAEDVAHLLMSIVAIVFLLPILAATFRRIHDSDNSRRELMYLFAPFTGWIIVFGYLLWDGDEGANRYGPPPPE